MEFNENSKRKVINVDLDGTLTNGEPFWKTEPTINEEIKEYVFNKYKEGNIIIIHTARQWFMASETVGWLIKNKIPFHGIMMGKGGSDMYVDDKSYRPEEVTNWKNYPQSAVSGYYKTPFICKECGKEFKFSAACIVGNDTYCNECYFKGNWRKRK